MPSWNDKIHRTSYRFMRVNRATGNEVERLTVLKGGTVTRNDDVRVKETAEAQVVGYMDLGPDLVRIYMEAEFADGSTQDAVLGTFLPVVPSRSINGWYSTSSVKMYGRLQELLDDRFSRPVTVPKGTNAVAKAREVCAQAGLEVVSDASDYTVTDPRVYGVGAEQNNSETDDTKLGMVNDLLDLAGFRSAFTDPMGRVVFRRYRDPGELPVSWSFEEGPGARFEGVMTEERDITDAANHVVVRYGDVTDYVVGEAWDTDPNSELSTVSRGRTITRAYSYNNLPPGKTASERQAYATQRAASLLSTAQSVIRRVRMTHVYAPVTVNDVVSISFPSGDVEGSFQVRTQTIRLSGGCPIEAEVRQFRRRSNA